MQLLRTKQHRPVIYSNVNEEMMILDLVHIIPLGTIIRPATNTERCTYAAMMVMVNNHGEIPAPHLAAIQSMGLNPNPQSFCLVLEAEDIPFGTVLVDPETVEEEIEAAATVLHMVRSLKKIFE